LIIKSIRVTKRSVLFFVHLLVATLICFILPLRYGRHWAISDKGQSITQWWSKRANKILGINISQFGYPLTPNCLVSANHISFLDIIVIGSTSPVIFLAKSSLQYWPVVGWIAISINTIFLQRSNKKIIFNTIHKISNILEQGQSCVIFPEGITTIGDNVLKFHSGLFQSAINSKKPVQPVALRYQKNGDIDRTAAYIENDNFIMTLVKIMAQKKTNVDLHICKAIPTQTFNRNEIAKISHKRIQDRIHSHYFLKQKRCKKDTNNSNGLKRTLRTPHAEEIITVKISYLLQPD